MGIFPECFKTIKVVPKKDKPAEKTKYRQISVLSSISKLKGTLMQI